MSPSLIGDPVAFPPGKTKRPTVTFVADEEFDALDDGPEEFAVELPHAAAIIATHAIMAAARKFRFNVPPLLADVSIPTSRLS